VLIRPARAVRDTRTSAGAVTELATGDDTTAEEFAMGRSCVVGNARNCRVVMVMIEVWRVVVVVVAV